MKIHSRYPLKYIPTKATMTGTSSTRAWSVPLHARAAAGLLVSPLSPIKVSGITREDRLQMAVHEFAHLLVDEINPNAPIWLDEGVACYEGSFDFYARVGRENMEKLPKIGFAVLQDEYYNLPGADLYAFYAVSFIVDEYGYGAINKLIRNPEELEGILGLSKAEFSGRWNSFMRGSD